MLLTFYQCHLSTKTDLIFLNVKKSITNNVRKMSNLGSFTFYHEDIIKMTRQKKGLSPVTKNVFISMHYFCITEILLSAEFSGRDLQYLLPSKILCLGQIYMLSSLYRRLHLLQKNCGTKVLEPAATARALRTFLHCNSILSRCGEIPRGLHKVRA